MTESFTYRVRNAVVFIGAWTAVITVAVLVAIGAYTVVGWIV